MQITIIEHKGYVQHSPAYGHHLGLLAEHDAREFRVEETDMKTWEMRLRALDVVLTREPVRVAEYYEDAAAAVEELWIETGAVSTVFDDGTILLVTDKSFSIYLPVKDDFEDQATHWVAAIPHLRELMVH